MVDRKSRADLIADRINSRIWAIIDAVPPIKPPPQFWLNSDAGPSFCWPCAVKARADEFGLGPPLREERRWMANTDLECAFYDEIDGGIDNESESAEACSTCGRTLSYILTDFGVEIECNYGIEAPLAVVDAEAAYWLDRLCLNAYAGMKRSRLLLISAVVNQAWRLLAKGSTHHG